MRLRTLLLVFALALPVLLAAGFPLRLALELVDGEAALSARSATGSVWNGRLHAASIGHVALGDARIRLSPLWLVTGSGTVALDTSAATLRLQHGRRRGLAAAAGKLSLPATALLPGAGLELQAEQLQLLFSGDSCHQASGQLGIIASRPDGTTLAVLHGAPTCEGRSAVFRLAAQSGEGPLARMHLTARIDPDGRWDMEARLPVVDDPAAGSVLEAMGFQPGPGGWSRLERGNLYQTTSPPASGSADRSVPPM
ncbi:type II secretion system protein N [Luteimonas sp. A277]